jgi:hypothetical protein
MLLLGGAALALYAIVMWLHTWRGCRADTKSHRETGSGSNLPEKTGTIDARDNCSAVRR